MIIVTTAQMRRLEQQAVERSTGLDVLMQRAGAAVARAAAERAGGGPILVLVGPGNNGGDGLVAASLLKGRGLPVVVYSFRRQDLGGYDGTAVAAESDENQALLDALVRQSPVIVDALLGIGSTRPPEGVLAGILRSVNGRRAPGCQAIAVDIPTGVNADTGSVEGEAFRASLTVAMGFAKCGIALYPGAEYAGEVQVADIGFPPDAARDIETAVPSPAAVSRLLPRRPATSNKGSSGRLMFVGGSRDFQGAPALATGAAYRAGAGLVEAAVPYSAQAGVAAHVREVIFRPLEEADGRIARAALPTVKEGLQRAGTLVLGPGMGLSDETVEVTKEILSALDGARIQGALVDADGLNALSQLENWWQLTGRDLVLTPHPGEMSRLTGLSISDIQKNRLEVAREHARRWGKVVVLKGAGTVVAAPDGRATVNPTGGPNLATAGTGDVLSGIIGGLLAQGLSAFDAAVAGVYLHGRAGDLMRDEYGEVGTVAGDLLAKIPAARLAILKQSEESP
ncbi:MAG: NAD(P)H-hydrate dehydratase [Chloroflexi bacterium]|nr:NAD(P)H-hydrate dehydratase [Chloroflexota bacterium]